MQSALKHPSLRNPRSVITRKHIVKPCRLSVVDGSYYVGQSIVLFTMFYCGLNWAHYRRMRIEQEKRDKS